MAEQFDTIIAFVIIIAGLSMTLQLIVDSAKSVVGLRWKVYEAFLKDLYVEVLDKEVDDSGKKGPRVEIQSVTSRMRMFAGKLESLWGTAHEAREALVELRDGLGECETDEEKIELDPEEMAEDPVPEEMKKEEKKKIEQVIIKKTTIIPKNRPPKIKRTLKRDPTKKKRRSLTSTAAKDRVRDKGALGALKNLNKGRMLGSKYGEEMDLSGKMLGDDGLADLGQDVFADLGGSADSDPFDLASADAGGGEVIPGRGEGPNFSASVGVDGAAIGGKKGPIVLGGAAGLDELKKSRLSKKTKGARFKEKSVRIMPKDIDMGGSGKLDKETVKKYIRKQLAGIKWCYQKAYQRNSKIEGKVTVSFIISATGKVIKSKIASSTLGDKPLEGCIEKKVLRWRFPEPKGGIVKVRYPFVLRPQ